jgi:hypothetical protein
MVPQVDYVRSFRMNVLWASSLTAGVSSQLKYRRIVAYYLPYPALSVAKPRPLKQRVLPSVCRLQAS